ncbi:hypothetical protein [Xenorhabdus szentirmaii]|nr:hypothetical protein [Xenorhabdus szentirmaii]
MADIQHTQTHPKFTSSDKTTRQKTLDLIQSVKKSAACVWHQYPGKRQTWCLPDLRRH